ncbi:hypothetical protein DXT99_20290 [Pontibacter diazotrophicus]|uniref:Uncharacterized protein n=1 Tax=Pontibacter diazotrophicus TaxID=1400979 RepID=A0A3D8L7H5_9BACT|nr:hypothetical protein DXT99_20290 [Pontibacter diazotrophicus]
MGKYKFIVALFVVSAVLQIILKDLEWEALISSLVFLLLLSCIISYVATQFHLKYNEKASHVKWWFYVYALMILFAAIP